MSMTEAPKPEGLRARKRRATENAIETSAVSLALEHGVENVTVEAICEQADISRSTFFNYFPARDYAIVGRAIGIPEGSDAFEVLDSSPDNLPLGIFRLLFAAIGHRQVNAEVARLRARLMAEQPEAVRLTISTLLESSYHLTTVTIAWLREHPEHAKLDSPEREATLAVTLVHGMVAAHMHVWARADGDATAEENEFLQALDDYRTVLG
ncbi:TetR/AcrR family transcriptional regulator [Leucobacter ruminantium]